MPFFICIHALLQDGVESFRFLQRYVPTHTFLLQIAPRRSIADPAIPRWPRDPDVAACQVELSHGRSPALGILWRSIANLILTSRRPIRKT